MANFLVFLQINCASVLPYGESVVHIKDILIMTVNRIYTILVSLMLCTVSISAADDTQPFVLVLDPGHGGKDIGAPGACRKTTESAVVLDVAKRVGRMVEDAGLDIQTVYTRKTDRFVTLQGRADIANKAHGDLFVSIHCNSVKSGGNNVQGTSVYTLGSGKSSENLRVAMRENSVIELEPDYTAKYSGFDPNSVESYILFELSQDVHIRQSIDFARLAQDELVSTAGRVDKKLRQANFWVLWATSMPAVLVELDFICLHLVHNPRDVRGCRDAPFFVLLQCSPDVRLVLAVPLDAV